MDNLRAISWLKGARHDFEAFPAEVRTDAQTALTIAARGGKADTAKPFKGVDGGVFEIVLKHRGNAYRVLYAVQIDVALWVIDAFQKKSKTGVKTPKVDADRIKARIKWLREKL
jgi:phage-related protein